MFVLGDLEGLVQGVTEKGKGDCGFGFDVAARDDGKDAAEDGGELRSAQNLAAKQRGQILTGLFCDEGFCFPLGVIAAEMLVARAARSAALAAIGKGESTQPGTVLDSRHGSLLKG